MNNIPMLFKKGKIAVGAQLAMLFVPKMPLL